MYHDKKDRTVAKAAGVLLAVLLVLVAGIYIRRTSVAGIQRQAETAMRDAVRRTAMQCYAVEGMYPPSLDYMAQNYGLRINTNEYDVIYMTQEDGQPPNIRVMKKGR